MMKVFNNIYQRVNCILFRCIVTKITRKKETMKHMKYLEPNETFQNIGEPYKEYESKKLKKQKYYEDNFFNKFVSDSNE